MATGTANFPELLWPGIRKLWGDRYNAMPAKWSQFFATVNSDKAFEKYQQITALPPAGIKNQGSPLPFLDPAQGYQKELVNVTYGLGSAVTREMFEDEQYNVINRIPVYLADSLRYTEEVVHHDVLNAGNTTQLSADGATLINTGHTLLDGTTLSNAGQSGVTYQLSQTSLEQAMIFIGRWTDDNGLFKAFEAKKLVVPTDLRFTAQKILETEFEVNTANNTINPVRGMLELVYTPFLTDTDSWFVITDVTLGAQQGLISQQRREASIERDNDFMTQNLLFSVTKRFTAGAADWRGVWGSYG